MSAEIMSVDSTSGTSNAATYPILRLPGEIRNQIHGLVAADGDTSQYIGYLLVSKQTYREALSEILRHKIADIEEAWHKVTGTVLRIKFTVLLQETHIEIGLPKSYFLDDQRAWDPVFIQDSYHREPPLSSLLRLVTSSLSFYLYDDPAFLSLNDNDRSILLYQNSGVTIARFCADLDEVASERHWGDPAVHAVGTERPISRGPVPAYTVKFEWGQVMIENSRQRYLENRIVRSLHKLFWCEEPAWWLKHAHRAWRYRIYRADGSTDELPDEKSPRHYIDLDVDGRVPIIGFVMDKIKSRGRLIKTRDKSAPPRYHDVVYIKDLA